MDKEKLVQLLKKYPFLWAIKKRWYAANEDFKVGDPDEELFQVTHFFNKPTPPCNLKSEIWIYLTSSSSFEVSKVVAREGTKLGEAILNKASLGQQIECIVIMRDMGGHCIIKPPKNISYNDFISNALENEKGG